MRSVRLLTRFRASSQYSLRCALVGAVATSSLAVISVVSAPAAVAADEQPVPGHTALVPDKPRTNTPRIGTGEIWDMAVIGDRVYIAGGFSSLTNTTGNRATVNQPLLAAYDINTGLVDTTFRPVITGGGVSAVEASPDGTKLYIGGRFNAINGVTQRKLASISPTTGAPVPGFTANSSAEVNAIAATNSTVYFGGRFATVNGTPRVGLAAVSATTGAVDTGFDNQLSGGIGVGGAITVQTLKLTHDNTKLVVVHTARKIAGQDRYGVGIIDTATKQLSPWRTRLWEDNLQYVGGIQRVFGGDVAPNDQYFVVGSGSGGDRPPINDTAIALPIAGGDNVEPLWVTRMFDSVYGIGVSEKAVYVGGHMSFTESQTSTDPWPGLTNQGYGLGQGIGGYALGDEVVRRDHIMALDPANGKALEWNPGSNSYEGNKAMLVTERGLFAGGDATIQGGVRTGRVAFYDFTTATGATPTDTAITAPVEGRVVPAGQPFTIAGTATSPAGIDRVQVEIIDAEGQYLQDDLATWGTFNTIVATLGATAAGVTQWSLPVTISDARVLKIQAKAFGLNKAKDPTKAIRKIETFTYGNALPTARITSPGAGLLTSTSFVMSGTANDDQGVSSVTVFLRDADDNYLTADGELTSEYTTFQVEPDVPGATAATWQTEVTLPHEGEWKGGVLATDTTGQNSLKFIGVTWTVDASGAPPAVTITAPTAVNPPTAAPPLSVQPGSPITFSGTATDDVDLDRVEIRLQNTSTRENLAADGSWGTGVPAGYYRVSPLNLTGTSYNWTYTTPFNLTPGIYTFSVRAIDNLELATATANQARLTLNVQPTGDAAPNGLVTSPTFDQSLQVLNFTMTGTATDDKGVSAVKVAVFDEDTRRYLKPDGTLSAGFTTVNATLANSGATSTGWSLPVIVPQAGTWQATAFAVDSAGQWDPNTTGAVARYLIYPGDADPFLEEDLRSPVTGNQFTDSRIPVSGRATDDVSVVRVEVAVVNSAGQYLAATGTFLPGERWLQTFVNSPGSVGSNYSYTTPSIPSGTYTVRVRPLDGHLQYPGSTDSVVTVTAPPGNMPPVAKISRTCTNNSCAFDARGTTDENVPTVTYTWNFGNGRTGSGPLPTYVFPTPGTFTVTLTARDEFGAVGTATTIVTVTTPPGNVAPTAVFPQPSCVGRVCAVSGAASRDANAGDVITYRFNWGDGTAVGTSVNGSHTYAAAGSYTITMTATDGWGASAAPISRTVTVTP
ncbi:MAG: PKD domain-containing protein [Nocardioides sp.]